MWSTPSSIARRSTARAASGSRGGPKTPGPASCIAPKPMRMIGLSPRNDVVVIRDSVRQEGRPDKRTRDPGTSSTTLGGSRGVEGVAQVAPEVLHVLESDAEAQKAGRDAVALPAGTGFEGGGDAAETRGVLDQREGALNGGGLFAVGDVKGQQRAEGVHVAGGHGI